MWSCSQLFVVKDHRNFSLFCSFSSLICLILLCCGSLIFFIIIVHICCSLILQLFLFLAAVLWFYIIIVFSCGSLIVKFDIGELNGDNEEAIRDRMRRAVDSLQLGEFRVSPLSYDFSPLDGSGRSKLYNLPYSHSNTSSTLYNEYGVASHCLIIRVF